MMMMKRWNVVACVRAISNVTDDQKEELANAVEIYWAATYFNWPIKNFLAILYIAKIFGFI